VAVAAREAVAVRELAMEAGSWEVAARVAVAAKEAASKEAGTQALAS